MASTPAAENPLNNFIALLGRRDFPTDGVADYSERLKQALARRGVCPKHVRVPWAERGWLRALLSLRKEATQWSGRWVLLQYTALGWSKRGFPVGALLVQRILRARGCRCAIVFHDAVAFRSPRLRDQVRQRIQNWTMRRLFLGAERSVVTVPVETLAWMPQDSRRATFIPIGANISENVDAKTFGDPQKPRTIAVFSVTGGAEGAREVEDILFAARRAKERLGGIRLEIFGRGALEIADLLKTAAQESGISLHLRGVIPADEITKTLSASDVLLCVRGLTTSRRGTAIAGIACGLPVVGYGQAGSDAAIDAAGVRLAPWCDRNAVADVLVQVLSDSEVWRRLHERSICAQAEHFSWDKIADRYLKALNSSGTST